MAETDQQFTAEAAENAEKTSTDLSFDSFSPRSLRSPRSSWLQTRTIRRSLMIYLPPILVIAVALLLATTAYRNLYRHHRFLWSNAVHDRNAHYHLGLSLALDLRNGQLVQLLRDLDGARIWPPLHGVCLAAVLLIGGLDDRLAVLPSLAGWVGTALFGFLAARRALPRGGNLAGLVASLFILASPAHRAFATDVMLESLGACLSLLVLYLYMVWIQDEDDSPRWAGRVLGIALTALFLEKYNYWLLMVLGLAAAEVASQPRAAFQSVLKIARTTPWKRWLRIEIRRPLNYLLVSVLAMLVWVLCKGGATISIGHQTISIHSTHNLLHIAYLIVFGRLLWWSWRNGQRAEMIKNRTISGSYAAIPLCLFPSVPLSARARQVLLWHILPLALWFLWPKRLSTFLWSMSPATAGDQPQYNLWKGLAYYWECWARDYHWAVWSAVLVLALIAVAVAGRRRMRRGGQAILWFLLIAAVLTIRHPNQKSRFLHSWIATGWVGAGVGLAILINGRLAARRKVVQPCLAVAALSGLGVSLLPAFGDPGHAPEAGLKMNQVSTLELTDCYLPEVAQGRVAILGTMPMKFLTRWTFLERYRQPERFDSSWKEFGPSPDENQRLFENWIETTRCDRFVCLNVPPDSIYYSGDFASAGFHQLPELLPTQNVFECSRRWKWPQDGCEISLWVRRAQTKAADSRPSPSDP